MSMLNKLKETQKNPVFMDDDDDIDNMDFPLPSGNPGSSSSAPQGMPNMNDLQNMMRNLQASQGGGGPAFPQMGTAQPSRATATAQSSNIAVAHTPQGIQRLDPSVYKNWVCIYPLYIDAGKTQGQGRKVREDIAVKNPHAYHMAIAVQQLGLSVVYEGKKHPRDWGNPGRVRVQLFGPNKQPMHATIKDRKTLMREIAKRMPKVQETNEKPKNMVTPTTTLAEVEAIVDEQRKAQGLPTLAEMQAKQSAMTPNIPKKQKVKYVRK
ncbi:signal recognition particle, SRP19 subunit [Phascolomyces articulosus]|uniref:Signal recognition particle, SRP19 subunit n=1 Tax=Phascolomyces articulosus TaxID=60185 RepID=A0AAD5P975_9FUNG|nr:signal recognition particle, SRP19 subunit [Phascolomyces articulosus]